MLYQCIGVMIGVGQTGVMEVCESLSIDKCHTLCERKYNIVEHIVQYLVLVKFLYVHVTAYLNDLVQQLAVQQSLILFCFLSRRVS